MEGLWERGGFDQNEMGRMIVESAFDSCRFFYFLVGWKDFSLEFARLPLDRGLV